MVNSGKHYELLTKNVFEELAKLDGLKILEITHNKLVKGLSGADHQIDVYVKIELLGQVQEIVIEAKDFQSSVDKPRLMAFVGVLSDLKIARGVFVTRTGFDQGNILPVAAANNIGLYVLDESDGPRTAFTISVFEHSAQIQQMYIDSSSDSSLLEHLKQRPAVEWLLYDATGVLKSDLQMLMNQAFDLMAANNIEPGGSVTAKLEKPGEELYFHTGNSSEPRIRFWGAVFERRRTLEGEKSIDTRMTHLLQLITNDKKYFVHESGRVYKVGDTMAIPFTFQSVGVNKADVSVEVITHVMGPSDRKDSTD